MPDPNPAEPNLEHLGRAWIRNGARRGNHQLVSCGRILLDRLGISAPLTDLERDLIEGATSTNRTSEEPKTA